MAHPRRLPRLGIGRRGAFVALFGLIYVAVGYSYTGNRPTQTVRDSLRMLEPFPLWACGLIWIATGAGAMAVGLFRPHIPFDVLLLRRWRVHAVLDIRLGFVLLTFQGIVWAGIYFLAAVAGESSRGWTTSIIFTAFAVSVLLFAGMVDPDEIGPTAKARPR